MFSQHLIKSKLVKIFEVYHNKYMKLKCSKFSNDLIKIVWEYALLHTQRVKRTVFNINNKY